MIAPESYKVALIGESKVGKTCIYNRYCFGTFDSKTEPTMDVHYENKEIKFSDNTSINLGIWDTTGINKYRILSKILTKGAKAIILIYDITNEKSFNELKTFWYGNFKDEGSILYVVGNKCDLDDKKVKDEEAKEYAEKIGASFFTVSAKDNIGLSALFEKIGEEMKNKHK